MKESIMIIPVFLPIFYGIGLLAIRGIENHDYYKKLTEVIVILNSLLIMMILVNHIGREGFEVFSLTNWLNIYFRLDGMGMVFTGLVAFLWPFATLYAFEYMEHAMNQRSFFGFYTMTYGVTVAIAMAGNIVTLYIFYEMLTLVTFPLVLHYKDRESRNAAIAYLIYSIGGATCAFIGMIFMVMRAGNGTFQYGGFLDFARTENIDLLLLVYVLCFFGFGVKAAIFPLHGWLPRASVAPTPVTALLHAVAVVKAGAFSILRLTYYCYGKDMLLGSWAQKVVAAFVMVTILYGSSMAVKEIHFKRRLAYSTVSNLSYILLGAVMMCPAGLFAALSHLVIHAFTKITGFFCAGAVMHKTDRHYIYELDGLGHRMPVTFTCFTIAGLSLMGVPLFAGFISKWNIAQAALDNGGSIGIIGIGVLLFSALLTAIYMLTVVIRAFFPGRDFDYESIRDCEDPGWMMLLPVVVFSVIIILLGVCSGPLLSFLERIAKGGI